jgi:uncharacterized membrane protein
MIGVTSASDTQHPTLPRIRQITLDHPWQWLAAGWKDLTVSLKYSLSYGVIFFLVSLLLTLGLIYGNTFFIIPPLAAGFFLVAPILGLGLYKISASLEQNQPVSFGQILTAWRANPVYLGGMCVVLVFILLVWMMIANLVFALFFDQPIPTWENFIPKVFLSGESAAFLFWGIASGGLMAAFTFAISAITVPLLMDRDIDLVRAMQTSVQAVRMNWRPMLLWACLITMFVGVGLVTFYIGLIVTMPLVGHATWHAYRDLVEPD